MHPRLYEYRLVYTYILVYVLPVSRNAQLTIDSSFNLRKGYLFISVLINHSHDLMKLVIQSIKNDLNSGKPIHISLALNCIANVGSPEMAEQLASEVPRILVGRYCNSQHLRIIT